MILSPADIGMPPHFDMWRPGQDDAIDNVIDAFSYKRFVVVSAPVGSGKTVTYVGVALLMGWRVLVVTSSKSLQDQLIGDFGAVGMVDIRGRGNYRCSLSDEPEAEELSCEDGPHQFCQQDGAGCQYKTAYKAAMGARLVTTNYTYQMLIYLYGEGLGEFDLVVLDEAHDAEQEVCGVVGQTFTTRQVQWMLNSRFPHRPWEAEKEDWVRWAQHQLGTANGKLLRLQEEAKALRESQGRVPSALAKSIREWGELVRGLTVVARARGPWAAQETKLSNGSTAYRLEPLWASQYAPEVLFRDFPRVLLVSATVRPKTMELLGVPTEDYDFQEYPYQFPVRRSPVYYLPTARVSARSTDEDMGAIISRIDELMDARQDRNGLIHSVSYKLARWIKANAIYSHTMVSHDNSTETRAALREFEGYEFSPPHVLVSPSIATGQDFKYRKAEYQIIPKLPAVVVEGNRIMQARCAKTTGDPDYRNYLMAQTLAQMIGRPMRAPDDRCETFILDTSWDWAQYACRNHFPSWVRPLVIRATRLPKPPPPLSLERGRVQT